MSEMPATHHAADRQTELCCTSAANSPQLGRNGGEDQATRTTTRGIGPVAQTDRQLDVWTENLPDPQVGQ